MHNSNSKMHIAIYKRLINLLRRCMKLFEEKKSQKGNHLIIKTKLMYLLVICVVVSESFCEWIAHNFELCHLSERNEKKLLTYSHRKNWIHFKVVSDQPPCIINMCRL